MCGGNGIWERDIKRKKGKRSERGRVNALFKSAFNIVILLIKIKSQQINCLILLFQNIAILYNIKHAFSYACKKKNMHLTML